MAKKNHSAVDEIVNRATAEIVVAVRASHAEQLRRAAKSSVAATPRIKAAPTKK